MKLIVVLIITFSFCLNKANAQWAIKNLDEEYSNWVSCIKFKNDSIGIFMGAKSSVLKTTNTGETWEKIQFDIIGDFCDFQFVNDSAIFAVGYYYPGNTDDLASKIIKSENLGETWDSIANFPKQQLMSLHFFSKNSGIVAGYDKIYRTTDSGISWDTIWDAKEYGYKYGSISQLTFQSEIGYAIGSGRNQHNNPFFENFILKSSDAGLTWKKTNTFPTSISSVHFLNVDTGFVGTEASILYKTNDGGETWTETQITKYFNVIKSIQFISDLQGFATGHPLSFSPEGPTSFFIANTTNGGETWTSYDTIGVPLNSIHFLNESVGFVSGNFNLIMKSNGKIDKLPDNYPWHLVGDPNGINDSKFPNSQIKIYPNPTNGILFIQNLNSNRKIKNINLLNSSGQLVDIRKIDANNQVIQLNLSELKSGIYILKIDCQDNAETFKIIKK